jgi:DNA-binding NtrC family response regulator
MVDKMDKTIKTLFIDDERDFLAVLVKRLNRRGMETFTANTGKEGLSALHLNPVDIVVLDICMPGMNGLETLRKIKGAWPLIEVILLTGHACLEAAREGMDEGAFDYLMKPVDLDELIYKLEDAYDKVHFFTKERRKEK